MSDAIDLKKQVMSLKHSKENVYDGVEVWADDETIIGSAPSGTLLTNPYIVYFPWNGSGTQGQTIAENIWYGLSGYNYNPYEASGAIIDPAVQLGDIVKIDGMRSVIASKSPFMDSLFATDIGAPEENEEDTEYQIETVTSRFRNAIRRANGAYASLKVNVDDIIAEVTDGQGNYTVLNMNAQGVVVKGNSGSVSIKGSQIEAGSLVLTDNITFNSVSYTASGALGAASTAQEYIAELASGEYTGPYTTGGTTFISGKDIYSPTIYANVFKVIPDPTNQGATEGAYELYCRRYGGDYATFRITCYYDNGAPYSYIYSPNGGYASWGFSSTLVSGTVQFTGSGKMQRPTVSTSDFGTSAPSGTGVQGQIYFQIES